MLIRKRWDIKSCLFFLYSIFFLYIINVYLYNYILWLISINLVFENETSKFTFGNHTPDGVYIIKYSVAPNDEVFVEYNHLRITKILNLYHEVLCGLHVDTCEPSSERWELIGEIHYIRTLIDAAVSQVEYCCSPTKGMDMYNYALKRLQKILCLTSSNC